MYNEMEEKNVNENFSLLCYRLSVALSCSAFRSSVYSYWIKKRLETASEFLATLARDLKKMEEKYDLLQSELEF